MTQHRFPPLERKSLAVVLLCAFGVASACLNAAASELLSELESANLALVETGNIFKARWMHFRNAGTFVEVRTNGTTNIGGVTRDGSALIMAESAHSGLDSRATRGHVDILRLSTGAILRRFAPDTPAVNLQEADVSADLNSLAIAGTLGPGAYGLYILKSDGYARRLVATTEAESPQSVGISPDGSNIVYDSHGQIFVFDLLANQSRALAYGSFPSWSPDGQWIGYQGSDQLAYLITPDGRTTRSVLGGTAIAAGLRWSPDSRYVLFTARYRGAISVARLSDGQTATLYTSFLGANERRLRWIKGSYRWPGIEP